MQTFFASRCNSFWDWVEKLLLYQSSFFIPSALWCRMQFIAMNWNIINRHFRFDRLRVQSADSMISLVPFRLFGCLNAKLCTMIKWPNRFYFVRQLYLFGFVMETNFDANHFAIKAKTVCRSIDSIGYRKCMEKVAMVLVPLCTQWHKINKFIYHSICRMFYMSVWLFLLHHQQQKRYGRFRTGFAQPNAITVKINGKSLIVERKLIYIHKYEICHQHAYWHIAVYSALLSRVAIVC